MKANSRIANFLTGFPKQGLHTIKLKELLSLRNEANFHRDIVTAFPPINIGSVTLVDQIALLCLEELLAPNRILEIGTFQGFTTRLFAKNSAANVIYSVDLPPVETNILNSIEGERILCEGDYNDNYLRDLQNRSGEVYLAKLDPVQLNRIKLVKQDSTTIDFRQVFGPVDYVFIDGGHNYEIVKSDTEKSLCILEKGVVVWHDFSSGIHSDVTRYLTERAEKNLVFHVNGSLCAFQLIGFD